MNFLNEIALEMLDMIGDNIPLVKCKPVYTLKECLNTIDIENLKEIYQEIYEKKPTRQTKEKLIEAIEKELPEFFINLLSMNFIDNIDEIINNNIPNLLMIGLGLQYGFEYKNKKIYVVPNELKEKYMDLCQKNGPLAIEQLKMFLSIYMSINGPIKKDLLKEIVKTYNINIDNKTIQKNLKENNIRTIFNEYYMNLPKLEEHEQEKEVKQKLKTIIEQKEKLTYKMLTKEEVLEYSEFVNNSNDKLNEILNTTNIPYISYFCTDSNKLEDIIDHITIQQKLNTKNKKKLTQFIEDNKSEIRYWDLNGRTIQEYEDEQTIEKMLLKEKPKDNSLKTCLNLLSKEGLETVTNQYQEENMDDLVKAIIEEIKEDIKDYDFIEYECLLGCHNKTIDSNSMAYEIKKAYVFTYPDKGKIKSFLPKEIKTVLQTVDIDELNDEFFPF